MVFYRFFEISMDLYGTWDRSFIFTKIFVVIYISTLTINFKRFVKTVQLETARHGN